MQITDLTQQLNAQVNFAGRGRSTKDITRSMLEEWRKSQTILDMLDAEEYFRKRNVSIQSKSRDYVDADGIKQENKSLSNAKIPSAFVRTNVLQKINYAFTKPFLLDVTSPQPARVDDETGEEIQDKQKDRYLQEWANFITPDVHKTIRRIALDAVNKGIGWAYVTIIDGQLQIYAMKSQQIYPAWTDEVHTELDAVVRDYPIVEYVNNERQVIRKVEFWGRDEVERYVEKLGELKPDDSEAAIDVHMHIGDVEVLWERVPFIALKGTEDELPMLNIIREQVDAYDALRSKSVDGLLDDIDPVLVMEGMTAEMGEIQRARKIIQNSRIVSLDEGGKAYYVQVQPDISAVQVKLEGLKKEIREFGQAVDTQDIRFGNNPSGVALKSMYQDLDIYVNGLESEFAAFMQNLKFFFDIWLQFRGIGTAEQWAKYKINVTFDRDMMINTSADILETGQLGSTGVSQETIDNWNPAVESHKLENQRRNREARAMRESGDDTVFAEAVRRAKERQEAKEDDKEV